jgi:hypothetical protein
VRRAAGEASGLLARLREQEQRSRLRVREPQWLPHGLDHKKRRPDTWARGVAVPWAAVRYDLSCRPTPDTSLFHANFTSYPELTCHPEGRSLLPHLLETLPFCARRLHHFLPAFEYLHNTGGARTLAFAYGRPSIACALRGRHQRLAGFYGDASARWLYGYMGHRGLAPHQGKIAASSAQFEGPRRLGFTRKFEVGLAGEELLEEHFRLQPG